MKIWIDKGWVHIVEGDDRHAAATLDELYAAVGQDFARRIAQKLRSQTGQFALMRKAVAEWLEEGGWK